MLSRPAGRIAGQIRDLSGKEIMALKVKITIRYKKERIIFSEAALLALLRSCIVAARTGSGRAIFFRYATEKKITGSLPG